MNSTNTNSLTTVAAVQFGVTTDREQNIEQAFSLLTDIDEDVDLIALPEMFTYVPLEDDNHEQVQAQAEPLKGYVLSRLQDVAREKNAVVAGGSFLTTDGDDIHNTAPIIDSNGEFLGAYRKTHLFDAPLATESKHVTPGDEVCVFNTEVGKMGVGICYDIRFPELFRRMAVEGAELFVIPSAFPIDGPRAPGSEQFNLLTRSIALQNLAYVVAINQIGEYGEWDYFGRSSIISPWGDSLSTAEDIPGIIKGTMDISRLEDIRNERRSFDHRRPELY
jgi:predicted amidohydrolase